MADDKISVAQEHYCTAVTQWVMSQLYPKILSTNKIGKKAIFVCVSGELHEIGGRMVADCLEMEGWDTFYLGANTPTDGILQALTERTPDVLGISVTMTSHLHTAENLIGAIRKSRMGQSMKILLGGRPFKLTTNLWRELGADGSACDATSAVLAAKHLVEKGEQDCAHAQIRRYSLAL